ncbi:Arginase, non-hepatic 3 [Seminavis robusta]|uniref:Arginase n=1 Tax=Seminavis robusta TaxID=568900 RepID=A0A9N8DYL8_9STRA|nr:Arginase, non-hepatic 3 [Seminavis robusta]|eukprot:Sro450_g145500.1 Arginase, non-hepatic 3 (369) ;mRNA; r:15147-16421
MFASTIRTSLASSRKVTCSATGVGGRCLSGGAGYGNVRDQVLPTEQETERELFQHCNYPRTANVISAPMTYGQPYVGTDCGPRWLKEAGLRSMLSNLGWRVKEAPALDFDDFSVHKPPKVNNSAKNSHIVGEGTLKLAKLVEETIVAGEFPLILGGDHSIGLGSLAAVLKARPDVGIIWVDAHADLNTPNSSPSGNMHGMPIGLLMDGVLTPDEMPPGCEWVNDYPRISPDSIVYVGLRDVDSEERKLIRKLNIKAFTMTDIDRYGIGRVMEMSLGHLLQDNPDRPLHLSYDIDAVDPVFAPATGTTVRGGLTFREAHYVAESVAASGNLASAEIVELNPNLSDGSGATETVDLGLQIVTSLMGKSII